MTSLLESHTDPLVLSTDCCAACNETITGSRVPCLNCFGQVSYCTETCLWKHYATHNGACAKFVRKFLQTKDEYMYKQHRLLGPSRGFPELIKHAIANIGRKALLDHLFFIRLPLNINDKFALTHPIKKIARQGCASKLTKTQVLKNAWKQYIQHTTSSKYEHLYFFTYPANMSFVFMTVVPLEAQHQFDNAQEPLIKFIPCPCSLHSSEASEAAPVPSSTS